MKKEDKPMRKACLVCGLLLLLTGSFWLLSGKSSAQCKTPSIFILQKSQTDTPAKPGQASSDADAAAHALENFVSEQVQNQYHCACPPTTDQDITNSLGYERMRQLLGSESNDQALSAAAGALGARCLVLVSATQTGGKMYLKASVTDTRTGKTGSMKDKQTGGSNTLDDAESLASDVAGDLASCLAVKPESGKTYPVGTIFSVVKEDTFKDHVNIRRTWNDASRWDADLGEWSDGVTEHCPFVMFTCANCTGTSNCTLKLLIPGRYRVMNWSSTLDGQQDKQIVAEFTIAGDCKK
jgi:hypothetical protein